MLDRTWCPREGQVGQLFFLCTAHFVQARDQALGPQRAIASTLT